MKKKTETTVQVEMVHSFAHDGMHGFKLSPNYKIVLSATKKAMELVYDRDGDFELRGRTAQLPKQFVEEFKKIAEEIESLNERWKYYCGMAFKR